MTECYDTLLPVITNIVNLSFITATVPTAFKEAVVDPILKKHLLDHEVCKNFRPISNLMNEGVVSKETVVLRRWGSSIQKFGFINGVDNVNWPQYRDSKSF